jgi:UDP-N-acetylmuramoyl-tripeptide--D-alanyl-D-alanine ligase
MTFCTAEVLSATQGRLVAGAGQAWYHSVTCDSRTAFAGSLFFALKGARTDGHQFVADAIARGARGAAVQYLPSGPLGQADIIVVEDPLSALGALGAWCLDKARVARVAVTGSAGKTTTKDMIACVLGTRSRVRATPENYNTEIGVPLTACALSPDQDTFVAEMAMRGPDQIAYLSRLVRPQVAVITNVGRSHVGLLGSPEAIREAKLEICEGLQGGVLWLPAVDEGLLASARRHGANIRTFGCHHQADVSGSEIALQPDGSTHLRVRAGEQQAPLRLQFPGRHHAANGLAAIGVGMTLGVSLYEACHALAQMSPAPHRGQVLKGPNGSHILDDTHNANPEAVLAALRLAADWPGARRRLALLADMLELGPLSEQAHREVGESAARLGLDWLGAVGDFASATLEGAARAGLSRTQAFRTKEEALAFLKSALQPGDVLLVKGSRAMQMEAVTLGLAAD